MMRTILAPAVLAGLLALAASSQVYAYGACRGGSLTYTNPYTGRSTTAAEGTAVGPNGVYHAGGVTTSGPNGTYGATSAHAYSPTMYGGYSGAGNAGGYGAAVVRYP